MFTCFANATAKRICFRLISSRCWHFQLIAFHAKREYNERAHARAWWQDDSISNAIPTLFKRDFKSKYIMKMEWFRIECEAQLHRKREYVWVWNASELIKVASTKVIRGTVRTQNVLKTNKQNGYKNILNLIVWNEMNCFEFSIHKQTEIWCAGHGQWPTLTTETIHGHTYHRRVLRCVDETTFNYILSKRSTEELYAYRNITLKWNWKRNEKK